MTMTTTKEKRIRCCSDRSGTAITWPGALLRCAKCVQPRHTPTDRRHLAQMHTPAEGGASPEGPLRRSLPPFLYLYLSLSASSSPSPPPSSLSLCLVHRGRCSFTAINLLPPRRRVSFPPQSPLASNTDVVRFLRALR